MTDSLKSSSSHPSLYALVSMGGLILLLLFMQGSFADKVEPGTTLQAESPLATDQRIAVVRRVEQASLLSWPGTVTAPSETRLSPRLSGRIQDITVRTGDKVRRGQTLVRLDVSELQAQLAGAGAALTAAEAQARQAQADDQRIKNLYAGEAATRQELDASTARAASTGAKVQEAREAIRAAESRLAETRITAPYDGVVIRRDQEPGDMALPGQPVLSLQQAGGVELEASVPVQCAGFLHTGDSVTVKPAHTEVVLMATVSEIQPAADPLTHTVRIKARLPEDSQLRPGTPASLQQHCGTEVHLSIPEAAITRSGQLTTVQWVAADGKPRLRHVRTGQRTGSEIDILAGLEPGDRVVVKTGARP